MAGLRRLLPLLGAIPLTGAIAGVSLALQSSLNGPPPGSDVAAAAVASLERIASITTLETLPGGRTLRATCSDRHHVDHLRIPGRFSTAIRGGRFIGFTGVRATSTDIVEAELAVCPGFAVAELSHRLRLGLATLRRSVLLGDGQPAYIVRIHGPAPIVDITLARPTLRLLRADVVSRSGRAAAAVVSTTLHTDSDGALRPVSPAKFLKVAENGIARTRRAFWNPRLRWYDERVAKAWHPQQPLAHLWSAFPLFEALDAVALADPTPANRRAVETFARGAERLFRPEPETGRRLHVVPGHHEPASARVFRRQRLVGDVLPGRLPGDGRPPGPHRRRARLPLHPAGRLGSAFRRHVVGNPAQAQDLRAPRGRDLHRARALPDHGRQELPRHGAQVAALGEPALLERRGATLRPRSRPTGRCSTTSRG